MPSINKLKKEIEILKDKIVNPNFDRNWKHNDPHWKYDIMFSDWLLFEYYRNKDIDNLTEYEKMHIEKVLEPSKEFNEEDLRDALNYFEENNINPIDDGYLETFVMFVCGDCSEFWESNGNDLPDEFYNKWNEFLKTHDFKLFI